MFSKDIVRLTLWYAELASPYSDQARIMLSETLHKALALGEVPGRGKIEAKSTNAWETMRNAGERYDLNCNCEEIEEQQVEVEAVSEEAKDPIQTLLQATIAEEAKQEVKNALPAIPELVEEAIDQLFRTSILSAQGGICTVVYDAVENVNSDQIWTTVFGDRMDQHVDKYFNADKAAEALGKGCSAMKNSLH